MKKTLDTIFRKKTPEQELPLEAYVPPSPPKPRNYYAGALRRIKETMPNHVIIESPFRGNTPDEQRANIDYARSCCLDAALRGEVPFASHLFFTQFMDDTQPTQRELGIAMGFQYWDMASKIVFYVDRGVSSGMKDALAKAILEKRSYEVRYLPKNVPDHTPSTGMEQAQLTPTQEIAKAAAMTPATKTLEQSMAELVGAKNTNPQA